MVKIYLLRDLWVSPVINRPFVWEMGNPTFVYNRNLKSKGSSFKWKNFWINSMCEYLGRTGYLTPILHCRQWGNIKWIVSFSAIAESWKKLKSSNVFSSFIVCKNRKDKL